MKIRAAHLLWVCALAGCEAAKAPQPAPLRGPSEGVAATVNGAAILEVEVAQRAAADAHGGAGGDRRDSALEALIGQELLAQRALELGVDMEPKEKEQLANLEAQVAAYRRKHLADAAARELARRVTVTDAEAARRFEQDRDKLGVQLHLLQILRRGDGAIQAAAQALDAGKRFEEVAESGLPKLPDGRAPWDLGWLRYEQLPNEWREVVYGLKDGETSGVLAGQRDRFWIVKVVARRADPDLRLEDVKATVVESLKKEKLETLRSETERALRKNARVDYARPAHAAR